MVMHSTHKVHALPHTGLSRTYLVETNASFLAVDVGSIGAAMDVVEYITVSLGKSLDSLQYITATHFHIDHIGGIRYLLKQCRTKPTILFHKKIREYKEGGRRISLIRNWRTGLVPASISSLRHVRRVSHFGFMSLAGIPLPGVRTFTTLPFDGTEIVYFGHEKERRYPLGFGGWEVIETPGHTEDSLSFFHQATGELISGDLIINIGKGGRGQLNRFHWSKNTIRESFAYLTENIRPKIIYPGHGAIIKDSENALLAVTTL
jgi:glyoxylase-like metal-dependent hydrolase (beta-lactamase superfamily II)